MRKIYSLVFILIHIYFFTQKKNQEYSFYENKGQIVDQDGKTNSTVKFLFNSNGLNVQLKKDGFSYDVFEVEKIHKKSKKTKQSLTSYKQKPEFTYKYRYHRVDIDFIDGNKNPEIIAEGKSPDYENYYNIPNKPNGITNVHRYQKITYKDIYPYVDLVFFKPNDTTKTVEYNFVVNPGGKVSDIQLKFNGTKTKLKDGKLSMNLRFGEMQENIPHSWEEVGDAKNSIAVQFKDLGKQVFGFETDKNISDKTIVIDPVPTRIWATANFNVTHQAWDNIKVITDKYNKVYTLDQRLAKFDIATNNYIQGGIGSQNYGYLACFDENGNKLWGSYLGNHHNSQDESNEFNDFGIDSNGNLIVVGSAQDDSFGNNNITTAGAFQEHSTPSYAIFNDAFVMKFNNSGIKLWGTYYGGEGYDKFETIKIDSNDNVILTGLTSSPSFISTVIQNVINGKNAGVFISKFTKDGQFLNSSIFPIYNIYDGELYSTLDKNDNIYVATTITESFLGNVGGTLGTHQTNLIGSSNVFLAKIDKNLNYKWGTYFGGRNKTGITYNQNLGGTSIKDLRCDQDENIVFAGSTSAIEKIATQGTHMEHISNDWVDMYIAKFTPNGQQIWGTYYGDANVSTSGDDNLFCMDVDENNNIFVGGYTVSKNNIATPDGYIPNYDFYNDGFFAKFNSTGNQVWGTYFKRPVLSIHARNNFVYPFTNYEVSKFYDCTVAINYSSNSPICPGSDIKLSASGGSAYSWSGPNGFSSALQNPTIPNASISDAGTYSCTISGTGSCDGTFTINVKVEDKTAPIPNLAILPQITGNCKTIIITIPTATDACKGNIIATTTNPLQYSLPGNYTINWNYDDGNGNIATQTQQVQITQQPLPVAAASQTFCKIENKKISDVAVTAINPKWYDASGNIISTSILLTDNTKYYVTQNASGCESAKKEILITLSDPNPPTGLSTQSFCSAQSPVVTNIASNGTGVLWYNSLTDTTPLPGSTTLKDGQTYYASQSIGSCESTQRLAVKVNVLTNYLAANDFSDTLCNDTTSNTKTINIDNYKKELISNPQDYTFDMTNNLGTTVGGDTLLTIGDNIFNIKIKSSLGCYQDVKLTLRLNPKPKIDLDKEKEFCDSLIGVTLDAGASPDLLNPYTYKWNSGETSQTIKANQEKTYTVIVSSKFGCQNTASVIVKKAKSAEIQNILITNNSTIIMMSSADDYLYSLDEINWQSSNKFENLENGNYTVYVKTKLDCRLGSKTFTIFSLSNVFTPNGDGINDSWKISGIESYPDSEVKIIDKNGRMVVNVVTKGSFEWDGKFSGRQLPTDSYWYQIKISDGRILEGYVVIKNRN